MAWSVPRTWVAGDTLTAAQLNADIRDNMNIIAAAGITGWVAYTATWTSSGTAVALGNGTTPGTYTALGKLFVARWVFTAGSTSTFGTGYYLWALPITLQDTGGFQHMGTANVIDSGGTSYRALMYPATTTTVVASLANDTKTGDVTSLNPMTWASGDSLAALCLGEIA